jgi:hypothetical protein
MILQRSHATTAVPWHAEANGHTSLSTLALARPVPEPQSSRLRWRLWVWVELDNAGQRGYQSLVAPPRSDGARGQLSTAASERWGRTGVAPGKTTVPHCRIFVRFFPFAKGSNLHAMARMRASASREHSLQRALKAASRPPSCIRHLLCAPCA